MNNSPTASIPKGRVARKRAKLRKRLLKEGLIILADKGISAFKISEVAEAADCSVGALYTHFDGRVSLLEAIKKRYLLDAGEAIDASFFDDDPRVALTVKMRYALSLVMKNPAWGQLILTTSWAEDLLSEGLSARVLQDIRLGVEQGLFQIRDEFAALSLVTGSFMANVVGISNGSLKHIASEQTAYHILIAFAVPPTDANRISKLPLPTIPEVEAIILE